MDELAAKRVLLDFEIILLLALVLGAGFFAIVRKLRPPRNRPLPDFDGFDLVLMFFPALLFLLNPVFEVLVTGGGENAGAEHVPANEGSWSLVVNIAYFFFVGVMTYGILEWIRNRRVSELFGLRNLRPAPIIFYSIVGGFVSLLICAWGVGTFSQDYLEGIFNHLSAQETVESLQSSDSRVQLGLSIVMACIAAPVVEEMLFRGYMYGALKRATNPVFSMVVIGGLFAVVHGNLPALLPLWAFSILLCCAYEWTRCLWVPIGMHAFFNAANIVLMLEPGAP